MKRRRGRPAREYNVRVRTERRHPIDFDAIARAALEQAAMDQQLNKTNRPERKAAPSRPRPTGQERLHDYLE